jgi:hypothetical protein
MSPAKGFQALDLGVLPAALSLHRGLWKVPAWNERSDQDSE